MKKILIPALCTFCITPAIADEAVVRPYIGANINFDFISYSPYMEDVMDNSGLHFSDSYFGIGLEAGVKFGDKNNIWNGGVAIAYDYAFDTSASVTNSYINNAGSCFSAWNIGFDNYIRVDDKDSKRTDLIFGIGVGKGTERSYWSIPDFITVDEKESTTMIVLKFGTNIRLNETVDWYTTLRDFIPSKDEIIKNVISIQTGIKLNF